MKPDIDAIKERAEKATPGPWESVRSYPSTADHSFVLGDDGCESVTSDILTVDADFIANARTDIPALLAYIAELEAERDAAVEDLRVAAEENGDCSMCSHYAKNDSDYFPDCDSCPCDNGFNKWEWRGVNK